MSFSQTIRTYLRHRSHIRLYSSWRLALPQLSASVWRSRRPVQAIAWFPSAAVGSPPHCRWCSPPKRRRFGWLGLAWWRTVPFQCPDSYGERSPLLHGNSWPSAIHRRLPPRPPPIARSPRLSARRDFAPNQRFVNIETWTTKYF